MLRPDAGGIEGGLGCAVRSPSAASSASGSSSRLHQPPPPPPPPRSTSSCSAAELRQLEWDSSFDFTARYPPSQAERPPPPTGPDPTERPDTPTPPAASQQAQTAPASTTVFAETDVNLVVASGDSSRSDRTGSTVITLRRQVSFPTINLKRAPGALDGLRGLTILFEGGERRPSDSEASFCSLAPSEPQQLGVGRRASGVSQQTEYASLSERLSSASVASQPPTPTPTPAPPEQQQQQHQQHQQRQQQPQSAAMPRPPRTPASPLLAPLSSRAPPSIEKCARWLARNELQVGHGDGAAGTAAAGPAADSPGRVLGGWRTRIQSGSQERVTTDPHRPGNSSNRASPAAVRKSLSDPLGSSAAAAAAVAARQPAVKSRSAHAGTAAAMSRQQHAESLARRPRQPAAAVSRSSETAPGVPSLHYLESAESDELIRRWRQDRKDFYQLAYLRRGDSDALSPAEDSGFSSSVRTQRIGIVPEQVQVYTESVPTVPGVTSAVPAASAPAKLVSAQETAAAAEPEGPPESDLLVLVAPRSDPRPARSSERVVPAASGAAAALTAPAAAAAATEPVPSRPAAAAAAAAVSASRTERPQTAPAGGRPRPAPSGARRPPQQQPAGGADRRRSLAAPAGSVRFSPSTQSAVGRGRAGSVTPRPSAAAVQTSPSLLGRARSSTFTLPDTEDGQRGVRPATAAAGGASAVRSSTGGIPHGSVPAVRPSARVTGSVPGVRSNTGAGVGATASRPGTGTTAVGSVPGVRPSTATGRSVPVVRPSAAGVPVMRPSAGGVPVVRPSAAASAAGGVPGVRASAAGLGGGSTAAVRGSAVRLPSAPSTPATAATDSPRSTSPSRVDSSRSSRSNLASSPSQGSPRRHSVSPTRQPSSAAAAVSPPRQSSSAVSPGSPAASPPGQPSAAARPSTSPTVRPSAVRRGSFRVGSVLATASRIDHGPTAGSVTAVRTPSRGRGRAAGPGGAVPQAPRPLSAQQEPNMRRNQPPPSRYRFTPSAPSVGGQESRSAAGSGTGLQADGAGQSGGSAAGVGAGGQTFRRQSVSGRTSEASTQPPRDDPSHATSSHITTVQPAWSGSPVRSAAAVRTGSYASSSAVPAPSPELHVRKSLLNRQIESGSRPRLRSVSHSDSAGRSDDCRPPLTCDDTPPPGSPNNSPAESDGGEAAGRASPESEGSTEDAELPGGYSGAFRRRVDSAQLPLVRDTIRGYEVRSRSASRERLAGPRPAPKSELTTTLTIELETERGSDAEMEVEIAREPEPEPEWDAEAALGSAAVRYSTDGCAGGDEESASEPELGTPAVPRLTGLTGLTGLTPPDSRRAADSSDRSDTDRYHPGQWRQQHETAPRRPNTRSRIPVRQATPDTPPAPQQPPLPPTPQPQQPQQSPTPPPQQQQKPQYASYELTVLAERSAGRQRSPPPPRRPDDYQAGRQARPGGPPRRRPPPQGCHEQRRAGATRSDTALRQRASPAAAMSPKLGSTGGGGGGSQRSVRSAPARRGPSTPRSERSTSSSEAVYTLGYSDAELRQARLVRRQPAGGPPLRLTLDGDGALEGGRAVVRRLQQHSQTQTDEFAHISSLLQLDLFPCQRGEPPREHADR